MPPSPARRGLAVVAAALLVGGSVALIYFLQVLLVDDRKVSFPSEDDRAAAPRFQSDPLIGRPGTGSFRAAGRAPEEIFHGLRALLTEHPAARLAWDAEARLPAARVTLSDGSALVRRRALVSPPGGEYEFPVLVPADGWLEFQLGLLSMGAGLTCFVDVVDERGAATPVFHDALVPRRHRAAHRLERWLPGFLSRALAQSTHHDERWRPVRVNLSAWARRSVRLRFRAEPGTTEGGEAGESAAFWGDPRVWGPRTEGTEPRRAGRIPTAGASVALVVLEHARGDGISLEGFSEQTPPRLRDFFLEGVGVRRFYTNAVEPAGAWSALLTAETPRVGRPPAPLRTGTPRPATWVRTFGENGYRTVAVGAFGDADLAGAPGNDFDEIHAVPNDGYAALTASAEALEWARRHEGRGPFLMIVYLRGVPRHRWPPIRFWALSLKRLPWSHRRWARWREAAVQSYVDDALGRFLSAFSSAAPDRPVLSVLSLAGSAAADRPVRWAGSGRRGWAYWSEPGVGLRESEVRGVWCLRHPSLPNGRLLAQPGQLVDVGPSLTALMGLGPPAGGDGRALDFRRESPTEDTVVHIAFRGREAKGLLIDGHYKYIRHRGPTPRRWRPRRFWIDYPREEVFDLWNDPAEQQNLAIRRRTLLARLRQSMDEIDPDPTDIRVAFRGADGARAQGAATCSTYGLRVSEDSTLPLVSRGRTEFSFTVPASSGAVIFETDPPGASYMMYLTVNGRYISPSRLRVSRFNLPLFESAGDGWHDRIKFPWMDGWAPLPATATETTAYLGRRERDPKVWRPALDRLAESPVWTPFPTTWVVGSGRLPAMTAPPPVPLAAPIPAVSTFERPPVSPVESGPPRAVAAPTTSPGVIAGSTVPVPLPPRAVAGPPTSPGTVSGSTAPVSVPPRTSAVPVSAPSAVVPSTVSAVGTPLPIPAAPKPVPAAPAAPVGTSVEPPSISSAPVAAP